MKRLLLIIICIHCLGSVQAQQRYRLDGHQVITDAAVLFKAGTAVLLPESDSALVTIKKYLDDKAYISLLRIEGHTEGGGDMAKKQLLSQQRALAVCRRLVKLGVDCKRLIAVGFGGTKPIAGNDTPGGRSQNSRISFHNAALRGRMIGGMPADGGGQVAGDACR